MLVFPVIMILMDWIIYVLLCNAQEFCEYSHSLRLKNKHSNQDIFFLDLILKIQDLCASVMFVPNLKTVTRNHLKIINTP
jgi:hypothetical protein